MLRSAANFAFVPPPVSLRRDGVVAVTQPHYVKKNRAGAQGFLPMTV